MGKLRLKEVKKLRHGGWKTGEQEAAEMGIQAGENKPGPLNVRRDLLGPRAIWHLDRATISLFPVPSQGWTPSSQVPSHSHHAQALGKGEREKRAASRAPATSCRAFALPTTSCVCKADAPEADKTQASGPPSLGGGAMYLRSLALVLTPAVGSYAFPRGSWIFGGGSSATPCGAQRGHDETASEGPAGC